MADISERLVNNLQGNSSRRVIDISILVLTNLIVMQVFSNIFVESWVTVVYDHEVI